MELHLLGHSHKASIFFVLVFGRGWCICEGQRAAYLLPLCMCVERVCKMSSLSDRKDSSMTLTLGLLPLIMVYVLVLSVFVVPDFLSYSP